MQVGNKFMLYSLFMALILAMPVFAVYPASPFNCTADNSVVNIAVNTVSASPGQLITYSVYAGNPASGDGCDIKDRTMTLTLPDSSVHVFGPNNYSNPSPLAFAGSANYVADVADVVGNTWSATVSWNGILTNGFDGASTGSKTSDVVYIPVNLNVTKTALPATNTTSGWTIEKTVSPASWNLFEGDTGTSQYNVTVTKGIVTSVHTVTGTITVHNPALIPATITGVSDIISGVGAATVSCPVSFPYQLAAGNSLVCTYSALLPDNATRTNTATATTTGNVGGDDGTASIDFANAFVINDFLSVNVNDTNGGSWLFDATGTVLYNETFDCASVQFVNGHAMYTHPNTATIVETLQSDSASVDVHCYQLGVTKNASTTFTRTYDWNITKSGSVENLTLAVGEQYNVSYDVTVDVASQSDSDFEAFGTIVVSNPNPSRAADLTSVIDDIEGMAATVNCPSSTVLASSVLECTYTASLLNGLSAVNNATATQQNYDYDVNGTPAASGTTDYSGQANLVFGLPTLEVDKCINATDDQFGNLGVVCSGSAPETFSYDLAVGPYELCGTYEYNNTASFVAQDTNATGQDSWTVGVLVPCEIGCSLTQGYWKTHSEYGPAPYDANWANLTNGADTTFYLSGQTWYEVLKTPPKGGNAYYQLAHQYAAAYLNVLNGASNDTIVDELADAEALFNTYTPAQVGAMKGNNAVRKQFTSLAGVLGSYNEGTIGPGHCDENPVV